MALTTSCGTGPDIPLAEAHPSHCITPLLEEPSGAVVETTVSCPWDSCMMIAMRSRASTPVCADATLTAVRSFMLSDTGCDPMTGRWFSRMQSADNQLATGNAASKAAAPPDTASMARLKTEQLPAEVAAAEVAAAGAEAVEVAAAGAAATGVDAAEVAALYVESAEVEAAAAAAGATPAGAEPAELGFPGQ